MCGFRPYIHSTPHEMRSVAGAEGSKEEGDLNSQDMFMIVIVYSYYSRESGMLIGR